MFAAAAALVGPSAAVANSAQAGTFALSGQLAGKLTVNTGATCTAGNIMTSDGVTTVRIYLVDHGVKPTTALWYLLFEVKAKAVHLPASYPTDVTLGADKNAAIADEWSSSAKGATGTVSFGAGYKSGSISVSLPAAAGQKGATRDEKIVGNWSC
jgi:hypothetical protein